MSTEEVDFWTPTIEAFKPLQLKWPELSPKLLKRPPFRFIADIVTSINTRFAAYDHIFRPDQLDVTLIDSKEKKLEYLTTLVKYVGFLLGKKIDVNVKKIIAGAEPEKTNVFLQCLALAVGYAQQDKAKKIQEPKEHVTNTDTTATETVTMTTETTRSREKVNENNSTITESNLPKCEQNATKAQVIREAEEFYNKISRYSHLKLDKAFFLKETVCSIVDMKNELQEESLSTEPSSLPVDALEMAIERQLGLLNQEKKELRMNNVREKTDEINEPGVHGQLLSRQGSGVLKRPRPTSEDSAPLRETLKSFGQRATVLENEIASTASFEPPSITTQEKVWSLILDIRPYICALRPQCNLDVPVEIKNLSQGNSCKMIKYVQVALRMYISVACIAASVPGVLLHAVLTLLSLLPVLGALEQRGIADERLLLKGIHQILVGLCRQYPLLFQQLLAAVLHKDAIGAFSFSAKRKLSYGRCSIVICDPPSVQVHSVSELSLFVCNIIAETKYECVSVACSFCDIMTGLFATSVLFHPTLSERRVLVRLACSLLAVDLQDSYVSLAEGNSNQSAGVFFWTPRYKENVLGAMALFHSSAGSLLCALKTNGLFIKTIHGHILLYTLVQHLSDLSQIRGGDVEVTWELELLRWLAEKEEVGDTEVTFLPNDGMKETQFLESRKTQGWLWSFSTGMHVLTDMLRALIWCASSQTSLKSHEAAELLLQLLQEVLSLRNNAHKLMELAFHAIADDIVKALLAVRLSPPILWFADMSPRIGVLHRLIGEFLPSEIVSSFVEKHFLLFRGNAPTDVQLLAAANASVVFAGGEDTSITFFEDASKCLTNAAFPLAVDAVVIFLRASKAPEVEKMAQQLLESLLSGQISFCYTEPPLRVAILYATLVEKLAIGSERASHLIFDAVKARDETGETFLWRIVGVLQGFRRRVAKECLQSMASSPFFFSSAPALKVSQFSKMGRADSERVNTVLLVFGEICELMKSLSLIITVFLNKDKLCEKVLLLFWRHMVALVTETLAISEWLSSTQSSSPNVAGVMAQSNVIVIDDGDAENEEVVVDMNTVSLSVNKGTKGHLEDCVKGDETRRSCKNYSVSAVNFEKILHEIGASMVLMGLKAQDILFSVSFHALDDAISDNLLAFICICVTFSSVRCLALEEVVCSCGLSHMNRTIRCGYAALALRILLARCDDTSVASTFVEKVAQLQRGDEEAQLVLTLEALEATFTGECQTFISKNSGVGGVDGDDDVSRVGIAYLSLAIDFLAYEKQQRNSHILENILESCIKIWERDSMNFSAKRLALNVARAIMMNLSWSVVDLCWKDTDMIYTSFFRAMCDAENCNAREVVLASLEDVLYRPICGGNEAGNLEKVYVLLGEKFTSNFMFPRVMAYILFKHAQDSPNVKIGMVQKLLQLQSRSLEELPEMMLYSRQQLIMSLIYLEAGRQLREAALGQKDNLNINNNTNRYVKSSICPNFNMVLKTAFLIMGSLPVADVILQALSLPQEGVTEGKELLKDVFYILDNIAKLVGVSIASSKKAYQVPVCIVRRCLLCLSLLIRLLGSYATSLAPKVPAILEHCSARQQLIEPVCAVWHDLLSNCTKEYLKEHSPAIIIDLLSIGQLAEGNEKHHENGDAFLLLEAAMRIVYESSVHEAFWESYFKVMGENNELIRRLKAGCGEFSSTTVLPPNVNEGLAYKKSHASVVIAGFLSVMQSSSRKCKEVFVRALFQYLSTTDKAGRMEMTCAAVESPQLIPTLLKCSYELHEDYVEYVLACIGMIGAVAHPNATLLAPGRRSTSQTVSTSPFVGSDHTTYLRDMQSLSEDLLDWRSLTHKLLSIYCPRALANTADPTLHDRAAYAVQQLLRVCTNEERRMVDHLPLQSQNVLHVDELQQYTWWSHLEPTCQRMLEGYTTTRYENHVNKKTEPRSPIYTSKMSFHEWLDAWFCDLVERCKGVFKSIIYALRNMAKGDYVLITFLIPHIILHILREGEKRHCDAIFAEIELLFHTALPGTSRQKDHMSSLYSQSIIKEVDTSISANTGVEEHLQFVFHILEDIDHVRLSLLRAMHHSNAHRTKLVNPAEMKEVVETCEKFFFCIKWTRKVKAAVAIGSNMRALRCVEAQRYLPSVEEVVKKNIPLQHIFASLGDRDSARSLHSTQEHQPDEVAFSYENNGEWSLALQACGVVLQQYPASVVHQFTALRCMQQLGQLHLMSCHCQALLMQCARSTSDSAGGDNLSWEARVATLQSYANEAAWRLGEWKNIKCRQDLPVSLALPMLALTNLVEGKGSLDDVLLACKAQRKKILPLIRVAFRESYAQVYPHVVLLHALTDVEAAAESVASTRLSLSVLDENTGKMPFVHVGHTCNSQNLHEFGLVLQQRARLVEATQETQELLLSLHRSIFRAFCMKEEVTKTWMHHAKMLRDGGFLEAALSAAEQVRFGDGPVDPSYYTTVAKLLHEMNRLGQAVEFAENAANNLQIPLVTRAKLRVLVTRWRQETCYQTSREVIEGYELALKMNDSEKAHHFLALFYDTLYRSLQGLSQEGIILLEPLVGEGCDEKIIKHVDIYVLNAIYHFGMALRLGNKTMSVSLPRMLTLWLNCSSTLNSLANKSNSVSASANLTLTKMSNMMERLLIHEDSKLSSAQLITALPQLLSRIGHDNAHLVKIIAGTVVDLMMEFTQQCLWQVLPIVFSKQQVRCEVANKGILSEFLKRDPSRKKLKENMFGLFRSLIELCNCPPTALSDSRSSSEPSLAGQSFMRQIQVILMTAKIILPTMANLSPNVMRISSDASPFSGNSTFQKVEDRVVIMSSLQKPKRITVISDEGERVPFLCKARDEPRKDMRMMEIASIMNSFFLTDPETRRKRFALRRYAVTALSDDCAIIEWVNNLSPFRKVVEDCYAMDGTGVRISQIKAWKAMVDSGSLSKLEMFQKCILPKAPPVLHSWFHRQFLNHQDWFNARNSYTQATALWSIAGHVVGLGDRHGENLMLDLSCGELMHVDFACLFDKGEMLEVPERVRFRLTQNVVDGMGVLGVDGPFRASCQAALRCQMKNNVAVMSVVETLLHEPLVEWTRHSSYRQKNFEPKQLIRRVSRRLDGFLDLYNSACEKDTFALSCEGQVSRLISHSSAIENLAEMYVWWMPWL